MSLAPEVIRHIASDTKSQEIILDCFPDARFTPFPSSHIWQGFKCRACGQRRAASDVCKIGRNLILNRTAYERVCMAHQQKAGKILEATVQKHRKDEGGDALQRINTGTESTENLLAKVKPEFGRELEEAKIPTDIFGHEELAELVKAIAWAYCSFKGRVALYTSTVFIEPNGDEAVFGDRFNARARMLLAFFENKKTEVALSNFALYVDPNFSQTESSSPTASLRASFDARLFRALGGRAEP